MGVECPHCDEEKRNENQLHTHKLLNHREEMDDEEATTKVSEGLLKEKEVEKGEQFGYE